MHERARPNNNLPGTEIFVGVLPSHEHDKSHPLDDSGIPQPGRFDSLDSLKIRAPELPPAMEDVDVVAKGAVAPCDVRVVRLRQTPGREPVEEIQTRLCTPSILDLVGNRLQPLLREE